jgi:hypothetical protein
VYKTQYNDLAIILFRLIISGFKARITVLSLIPKAILRINKLLLISSIYPLTKDIARDKVSALSHRLLA